MKKSPHRGKRRPPSLLFHADSGDPDMRYFSRFLADDPYLAFTVGRKSYALSSPLEYGRMVSESAFDEILLEPEIARGAARRFKLPKGTRPTDCQMVRHLAALYQIREFRVGARFPAGLFSALQQAGVRITAEQNGGLFPQRQCKTADEVALLRKANRASAAGFRVVTKTLSESTVRGGKLIHQGKVLTSERLRELIRHACLDAGALAVDAVASPGDQACDNHLAGHGPIRAGELIVVDIFPRRPADGYWGDMTRTYLKGKASDAQRRLVRTVRRAHRLAIGMIRPGVSGSKVHEAVERYFAGEGYESDREGPKPKGFFHDLGHGVGIELHEDPFMWAGASWKFKKGQVLTVEPGLYYRGLGGCRIEDVVHVVPGGNEKISSAPYRWEIA